MDSTTGSAHDGTAGGSVPGRSRGRCFRCGTRLVPYVVGLPDPDLWEAAERGEVVLGGCLLGPWTPSAVCPICHRLALPLELCAGLPVSPDGRVPTGVPVLSRSGRIEGRTTGGRRRCGTPGCSAWLLAVSWRTGQRTFVCTAGVRVDVPTPGPDDPTSDPSSFLITILEGAELTGRPEPGPEPLPESQWPEPADLIGPAWAEPWGRSDPWA